MTSHGQYALFDWDNTVRNGYTLFSWVDYLCANSIIDSHILHDLNQIQYQYNRNKITHNQYAQIACTKYAKYLAGVHVETINNSILNYIDYDRKFLFSEITSLFELLHKKNIDIIVISGAPLIILETYKNIFHLNSIYAFREQTSCDIFTGNVEYNYGYNKLGKILELIDMYNCRPCIAFGDSESDVPMLNYADYAFCTSNLLCNKKYINFDPNNISDEILNKIRHL